MVTAVFFFLFLSELEHIVESDLPSILSQIEFLLFSLQLPVILDDDASLLEDCIKDMDHICLSHSFELLKVSVLSEHIHLGGSD